MPRIPSREEPYHSVAKCNRHWKTKREFVTKAANKASHVDGSHYLLVCVTPKGSIEVHASEHFHDDTNQQKVDGVINWDTLRRRATAIQAKNEERWTEIERQEKRFGVEGDADDDDDDDDDVGDTSLESIVNPDGSQGRMTPAPLGQHVFSAAKTPSRPISSVTVTPDTLDHEYCARFEHLGQNVCANILKAWIKVVEPKKQTKYPYKDKKGNEGRPPPWWPKGMRHVEPDHLHKDERPRLLASIIQQASRPRSEGTPTTSTSPDNRELTISRLHFATAEIGSSIPPRPHYELRQIYLIAKEVRKANEDRMRELRAQGIRDVHALWSEVTVDFFEKPPNSMPVKRAYPFALDEFDPSRMVANKENMEYDRPMKRGKHSPSLDVHQVLTPLQSHQNVYAVQQQYSVEQHPAGYQNWQGVQPVSGTPQPTSAPPTAMANHNQAYYRPFVADMSQYSYSGAYGQTGAQYPSQSYGYQIYQGAGTPTQGTYPAPATPGSQAQPTPSYSGYTYDSGQAFVSDLGLSA